MKRTMLFLWTVIFSAVLRGQPSNYQTYIERYSPLAIEQMKKYGVPASITLAQALLESGAGTSHLATAANNHFGIKLGGTWDGPYITKDDDQKGEKFRKYNSVAESYEDHSLFLKNRSWYASLFELKSDDYKGWAHGLKAAGYATNPEYANKLISIIEIYKLHQYDKMSSAPAKREKDRNEVQTTKTAVASNTAGRATLQVHRCNDDYYISARSGDTYKSIARLFGSSESKLRRYNEVDRRHEPQQGEIVYLEKKRKKVAKVLRGKIHVVRNGESMYSIAQMYAIRIGSLYKANNLNPNYMPRVGDRLLLR